MSYPEKPVILQIIPELSAGGAERTAIEMAAAIVRAGGVALVASEGGRLVPELEAVGGELVPLAAKTKNPVRILANAAAIARIARHRGVHLIHARSRAPAWSARLAARRLGLPFVTTYHGVYNQTGTIKGAYNSVMASGDAVIANSHFTAAAVRARHGTPATRLHIIHRGVDLAVFDPDTVSPERIAALRAAWRLDPHHRAVLYAARLTRWKGQDRFIEAVARVKDAPELADAVFVLAGDAQGRDAYEAGLRQQVAGYGLEDRFRFAGHCSDMPAAFSAAVFSVVAPTGEEAFGRVSAEAQAMRCPVLAADIGALRETIAPDLAAEWMIPANDTPALAAAIRAKCALSAAAHAEAGKAARAFVAAHFSIEQMQTKTLAVYDALIESRMAHCFVTNLPGFPLFARA